MSVLSDLREASEKATPIQSTYIGGAAMNEIVSRDGRHVGAFTRREDAELYVLFGIYRDALLDIAEAAQEYIEAQMAGRDDQGRIVCNFDLQREPRKRLIAALASLESPKERTDD